MSLGQGSSALGPARLTQWRVRWRQNLQGRRHGGFDDAGIGITYARIGPVGAKIDGADSRTDPPFVVASISGL